MTDIAVRDVDYYICNVKTKIYHYDIDTRNIKPGKSKYTPHQKHLIAIARHEGKYHAYGKIDEKKYGNFTISENQIVYYDDLNKTEEVLFDISIGNIDKIDIKLLIGFITSLFHSLTTRLKYDITVKHGKVNHGHAQAGLYTINSLYKSLQILQENVSPEFFKCVNDDILLNFGTLDSIEKIYKEFRKGKNENTSIRYYNEYVDAIRYNNANLSGNIRQSGTTGGRRKLNFNN
jgi:hypothetical protein